MFRENLEGLFKFEPTKDRIFKDTGVLIICLINLIRFTITCIEFHLFFLDRYIIQDLLVGRLSSECNQGLLK
jgi:hypothetical protein